MPGTAEIFIIAIILFVLLVPVVAAIAVGVWFVVGSARRQGNAAFNDDLEGDGDQLNTTAQDDSTTLMPNNGTRQGDV